MDPCQATSSTSNNVQTIVTSKNKEKTEKYIKILDYCDILRHKKYIQFLKIL